MVVAEAGTTTTVVAEKRVPSPPPPRRLPSSFSDDHPINGTQPHIQIHAPDAATSRHLDIKTYSLPPACKSRPSAGLLLLPPLRLLQQQLATEVRDLGEAKPSRQKQKQPAVARACVRRAMTAAPATPTGSCSFSSSCAKAKQSACTRPARRRSATESSGQTASHRRSIRTHEIFRRVFPRL